MGLIEKTKFFKTAAQEASLTARWLTAKDGHGNYNNLKSSLLAIPKTLASRKAIELILFTIRNAGLKPNVIALFALPVPL